MAFDSRVIFWYPIVNHIREALTDYYTTWENEGRVQLSESVLEGNPYSFDSADITRIVMEFKISNWNYKMRNRWRGINCEDEMSDSLSGDRVHYSTKIDFAETEESDGTYTYTYTVTCVPDEVRASRHL